MKSVAKSQINMYIKGIGQWCPIIHSRSQIMTCENFIKAPIKSASHWHTPAPTNTNRSLGVNLVYFICGTASVLLYLLLGATIGGNALNAFWNIPFYLYVVWVLWLVGISGAVYAGYVAMRHLFTALRKIAKLISCQAATVARWMDSVNIG